jgi:hypothetical protein
VNRPPFEVADIARPAGQRFIDKNRSWLTRLHRKVLSAIECCRTAALGGHKDRCTRCGYKAITSNYCRNRHCPTCQTNARDKWPAARHEELLAVPPPTADDYALGAYELHPTRSTPQPFKVRSGQRTTPVPRCRRD